jgi:hypothetical protein
MLRLFDSLMRNYPIQTLLFWRTKDEIKARKFMPQISWDADLSEYYDKNVSKSGVEKVFVLDGQQRLQTLYATFYGAINSPDNRRAEAYFDLTSGHDQEERGLMFQLCFSPDHLDLPWYRVANIINTQQNAEELADRFNETLDALVDEQAVPGSLKHIKGREKRVRRNVSQLVSLLARRSISGCKNWTVLQTIFPIGAFWISSYGSILAGPNWTPRILCLPR